MAVQMTLASSPGSLDRKDARQFFERRMARQAATRAKPADIVNLNSLVASQKVLPGGDPAQFIQADRKFQWVATAPVPAEPCKGSDADITKDGMMHAMVGTFDGAALKKK